MKKIEYKGIKTNNLKNIDIDFFQNDLVVICGDSGSGKSSLAFDTIAAISQNEFDKLTNDNISDIQFDIDYYSNVIPVIALRQLNFNVNPRSTILSYFGLFKPISLLINEICGIGMKEISLNGSNRCKKCNGLGYNLQPNLDILVDFNRKIKDMPFICWRNSYKDYYQQSLNIYCYDNDIDINLSFNELNDNQKQILLSGTSNEKYKISYKNAGKKRSKTAYYIGPLIDLQSPNSFIYNRKRFMIECNCEECNGSRLNKNISSIKLSLDMTVGKILTSNFLAIYDYLHSLSQEKYNNRVKESIKHLLRFVITCEKVNISHLSLSRSISSLSGGELQRLRIVQLLMGKMDNLMIVVDEPTASLHPLEAKKVMNSILDLNKYNTIILVEHNLNLVKNANKFYFLGPGGGKKGGNLISYEEYFMNQNYDLSYSPTNICTFFTIPLNSRFVNYMGEIKFALNCINGICGLSGIGKTTILKEILPMQIDAYKYISQKSLKGNSNSTVATYTGLLDEIRNIYSKESKLNKSMFSNSSDGACLKCSGLGKILIGDFYDEKIYETCSSCKGTGYSNKALKTKVLGYNIAEILDLEVNEIKELNISSIKLKRIISILDKLDLSHIKLNQKISTLSGGENQRIKLALALLDNKAKVIGLDEPTKGLSERSVIKLINILYEDVYKNNKTYIVAEHNPLFLSNCTFINELDKQDNYVRVLCSGSPKQIKNNEKSIIKNWIILDKEK